MLTLRRNHEEEAADRPFPAKTEPQQTRSTRSRFLIPGLAAGIAVLVAVAVLFSVLSRHDGREHVSGQVADTVAPRGTTSLLVTPASGDWWKVIAALSDVTLPVAQIDVPANAQWTAIATSPRKTGTQSTAKNGTFQTVLIGFATNREARRFDIGLSARGNSSVVKGNIVYLASAQTSVESESFPVPKVDTEKVTTATWTIDLTNEAADLAKGAVYGKNYLMFQSALGVSKDTAEPTTWKATATSVNKGFTGKLKNWNEPAANVTKAVGALESSAKFRCDVMGEKDDVVYKTDCAGTEEGLSAVGHAAVIGGKGTEWTISADRTRTMGKDYLIYGSLNPRYVRAVVTGLAVSPASPVKRFEFGISKNSEMTIVPVL